MNQIAEYFNKASQIIQIRGEIASTSNHRGDNGANRENALREFLDQHLPERFAVMLGGKALGMSQAPSKQIDIFVKNDLAPKYLINEKSFALCETISAAISVKTHMKKDGILDTLSNLSSIPQHSERALRFKIVKQEARMGFDKHFPVKVGFGFDGIKPETAISYINPTFRTGICKKNNNQKRHFKLCYRA